jgi:subtilisin family serine protease
MNTFVAILSGVVALALGLAGNFDLLNFNRINTCGTNQVSENYVVVFHPHISNCTHSMLELKNVTDFEHTHVYCHAIKGIATSLTPDQKASILKHSDVATIEPEIKLKIQPIIDYDVIWNANYSLESSVPVKIAAVRTPTSTQKVDPSMPRIGANLNYAKIGATGLPNVDVFVLDTGITHPDINVVERLSFISGATAIVNDDNGHGTHVAGIIGAKNNNVYTVGVAPNVRIHSLKIIDASGSGTSLSLLAALDHVMVQRSSPAFAGKGMVVSLSLGGDVGTTDLNYMDIAIQNGIAAGIVFCIAAGNSAVDVQNSSPAHVPEAITVGAYDDTYGIGYGYDYLASFSNYGSIIDIQAPGVNILSTYSTLKTASGLATLSGTSMATPFVTGTVALYLNSHPTASPAAVLAALKSEAAAAAATPNGKTDYTGATDHINRRIDVSGIPTTTDLSIWAGSATA